MSLQSRRPLITKEVPCTPFLIWIINQDWSVLFNNRGMPLGGVGGAVLSFLWSKYNLISDVYIGALSSKKKSCSESFSKVLLCLSVSVL